jgi:DNA-binding transcriptional MerR regulator
LSVGQIRDLLSLWNEEKLPGREVSRLAVQNIAELDVRINRMKMLRQAVEDLVSGCERERRPHSPAVPE